MIPDPSFHPPTDLDAIADLEEEIWAALDQIPGFSRFLECDPWRCSKDKGRIISEMGQWVYELAFLLTREPDAEFSRYVYQNRIDVTTIDPPR